MQQPNPVLLFLRTLLHRLVVLVGASALTFLFFMILPLIQQLTENRSTDLMVQTIDTAQLDAPPPPPEEEEEEEPEPEEQEPPELTDESPPLDLSQLELALNPGVSDGWLGGDFAVNLNAAAANAGGDVDKLFSVADLDQKPRAIYQSAPTLTAAFRKRAPGTVYIIFIVNQQGRVTDPIVQSSTDPIFEKPALDAIKNWKFEPGKRGGKPVRFRMRVPITFPKGL
ncbi:MAG: energy transducer TonB [Sumerlaeia bacterium]